MRNLLAIVFCVTLCSLEAVADDPTSKSPDSQLRSLLDEVWDFELTESPMLATNAGDPRGQDRLADDSLDAIDRRNDARQQFLERLTAIDPTMLSAFSQIDQELLRLRLEGQLADHRFQTHRMSINNREGFHIGFPELPREMNPKSVKDFANYVARLRDFGRYADQQIALLRSGIEAGLTQPSIVMRDSVDQAMAHVVDDPDKSLLMTNVSTESRDALGKSWEPIAEEIRDAIRTSVVPAYQRFADFLKDEYVPACRGSIGASALPRGSEFYRDRILRFTTLPLTPIELHETGIRENARIRKEMQSIIDGLRFDGDFDAFLNHLRTDPKFYAKTPEELLRHTAMILKTADGRLPELFGRLPRIPYGIREVPDYVAPQTTSAYYWPPSTDGKRAGFYYINTYNLSSRPIYQLESLSMHEAVPGHHLQLALQAELTDLHPISRESNFTAFIEGWALYSERLGKEIGFYQDPYQDFGRLSMEAWRASRLVVDTGLHAMGWSRQQAIDYMKSNTALSEHNVVAEVDRYIGWPGQALAYKTGELAISRLRRSAETKLGDRFDVRAFHDRVLESGSIPLPLLETRVNTWIDEQLALPESRE
ncbi:hypothetical protein Poly51_43610 [Rubripirellula tenax]|uniref:DUF885 domain-containing protein n=1 Tax=Rubripirellula tenax TaxID=2528015 RepID=A0A5C6ESH8_9BACT|nr:DUF885 domain-containing protein [Rubripirellula tenax]TWU51067.1 hypothetical protein Poly51_43610 [Rubripirellula tenax]